MSDAKATTKRTERFGSYRAPDHRLFQAVRSVVLPMLFSASLLHPAGAQNAKQVLPTSETQPAGSVIIPNRDTLVSYKPSNRRDPFLNPLLYRKSAGKKKDEEVSRGVPPPGIAGTYISQAVFQGIAISDTSRVAVVRGSDKRAYFLREGDKLFDGYLKSIGNDYITFVRKTRMKSGKVLTLDIIKRLRKP